MSLSVVNWNVEWATPRSPRAPEIRRRIDSHNPEVVCLTETHERLRSRDGHTICSQADAGYRIREGRRKVMLWSMQPWEGVDDLGDDALPPGRFVSGVTRTSLGEVTVVGVCIPWFGSRTEARRGGECKQRWEDHEQYLEGLGRVLERASARLLIVLGDFNQIIGAGSRAGPERQAALKRVFSGSLRIATADLSFSGRKGVDHIALSDDLLVESTCVISNVHDGRKRKLSDHFGVVAELSARPLR